MADHDNTETTGGTDSGPAKQGECLTVRLGKEDYRRLRACARAEGISCNNLVSRILHEYVRKQLEATQ